MGDARARVGPAACGDGALRATLRARAQRRLRLEHGTDAASLRRRQRRRHRQSRARARHARTHARGLDADPRPQRCAGRRRVRQRAESASRRRSLDDPEARAQLRDGLALPDPDDTRNDDERDARRRARAARSTCSISSAATFSRPCPIPTYCHDALARVPLRVHQDIVLNTSTLVEAERVLVLPAATRYEQRGGGTSTTHRAAGTLHTRDPRPTDRRGARRMGDPRRDRPARGRGHAPPRLRVRRRAGGARRDGTRHAALRGHRRAPARRRLVPVRRADPLPGGRVSGPAERPRPLHRSSFRSRPLSRPTSFSSPPAAASNSTR